jgi:hypothetical protein
VQTQVEAGVPEPSTGKPGGGVRDVGVPRLPIDWAEAGDDAGADRESARREGPAEKEDTGIVSSLVKKSSS